MNLLHIGRVFSGMALLCLLTACEKAHHEYSEHAYAADTVSYPYDPEKSELPAQRMMIRKAEMNFKVKELQKTSQKITAMTAYYGGEIWNSHLRTEIQNSVTRKISADSLREVITHRQTNNMQIRVPSKNLDSLLTALEELSLLLHYKSVTSENVSLEYLSNELKAKNMARTQSRLEGAMQKKKAGLEEYTNVEYSGIDMQNNVIDKQIQNMSLMDKVQYSTVNVSIYQDKEVYTNVIANLNADRFDPGFFASSGMAIQEGWEYMLSVLVFFIRLWPLYLLGLGVFFLIRYLDKFRSKVSKAEVEN